jgi:hypothetical protein
MHQRFKGSCGDCAKSGRMPIHDRTDPTPSTRSRPTGPCPTAGRWILPRKRTPFSGTLGSLDARGKLVGDEPIPHLCGLTSS